MHRALHLVTLVLLFYGPLLFAHEIRLRITDENDQPIAGVQTSIVFTTAVRGGETHREGLTDRGGFFSGSGRGEGHIVIRASKPGHYEAGLRRSPNDQILNQDLTLVLPKIIQPVPLRALNLALYSGDRALKLDVQNQWLDYDLAAGDWVKPRGKGEITDIRFRFRNEFKGWTMDAERMGNARTFQTRSGISEKEFLGLYGKFDGELEISFPGEKEGLVEVRERFWPYSRLTMPHQAPTEGYVPARRYTAKNYPSRTDPDEVGFFLRTRVKLDKDGKIVSANYAKISGDFHLDARGFIGLTYYFNPVPNDRNLEFDPKRNLFPSNHPGANFGNP